MANNIIPLDQLTAAHLPQKMVERRAQGMALNRNFIEGIRDAFPTLSIKGKVFRFRHQGVEQMALDEHRRPVSFIDVVLVDASPYIAKTYYAKGYVEGDMDPPDCWSLDSIKPDPSVENKVNPTCLNCPMNQFGSRVTDRGAQAKACQDQRRIAITMDHQLSEDVDRPLLVLSRIPQGSLKNLKIYADMLDRYGVEINGVITRLSFEPAEAFPKLLFEYAGALNDSQYDRVLELSESEEAQVMLNAPITDAAADNLDASQTARTPPRPAARPAPPSNVMPLRPATPAQAPLATPAAQAAETSRAAREEVQEQTGIHVPTPAQPPQASPAPALPGTSIGGLVALGDGRFYNPVTQALCDANGQPFGSTPAADPIPPAETPPMSAAQGEARTWVPPQADTTAPQPAPAAAPAATPGKRTRRAAAPPAADATQVSAAPPALESLLSKLMPKQ